MHTHTNTGTRARAHTHANTHILLDFNLDKDILTDHHNIY